MTDFAIPVVTCIDCGVDRLKLPGKKLRRGRCEACYRRLIRAAKRSGAFERLPVQAPESPWRVFERVAAGPGGCLVWTGSTSLSGYGRIMVGGQQKRAHRIAYELVVGPVPEGLVLDHTCHNRDATCFGGPCFHRRCVNPLHLEVVTSGENTLRSPHTLPGANARKTHCVNGHEFTPSNTIIWGKGSRSCRACTNTYGRLRRAIQKSADRS